MAQEGMFLSAGNEILADAIGSRLLDGVREPCEITVADFDDVMFKLIVAAGQENLLALHIAMPAAEALRAIGCEQVVERVYPGMKGAPVDGYSFCVCVDADACAEPGAMLEKLTLLKRYIAGAPLTLAFEALLSDGSLPRSHRSRTTRARCATSCPAPTPPSRPRTTA